MLKFGTPTIALPLAIKKCTVQTGCTVYSLASQKNRRTLALFFLATTNLLLMTFQFTATALPVCGCFGRGLEDAQVRSYKLKLERPLEV